MAGSVNKVILIGNLGQDPEAKNLNGGGMLVNLSIATSETWRDKSSGERKEKTEWHKVVVFAEGPAKFAEQYLKKGMKVYVEGQLQTRKWQDQSGQDRYTTEVVIKPFKGVLENLTSRDSESGSGGGGQSRRDDNRQSNDDFGQRSSDNYGGGGRNIDDDIPFAPEWR